MKNALSISVKKPCTEKFENFSPTANGGFCDSCQKEVIDFTAMTSKEMTTYFNTSSSNLCGRFKASQLKTHEPMMNTLNKNFVSRGIAVMSFSLLSLCATSNLQAQEVASNYKPEPIELNVIVGEAMIMGKVATKTHTVRGKVLDEENEPLPGVNVFLKGTTVGVSTDLDGKFEFPRQLEVGDVLVFSYIGFEPQEYQVKKDEPENIDITMTFDYSKINLMGEVVVGGVYVSKRNIFQKLADLFRK